MKNRVVKCVVAFVSIVAVLLSAEVVHDQYKCN